MCDVEAFVVWLDKTEVVKKPGKGQSEAGGSGCRRQVWRVFEGKT